MSTWATWVLAVASETTSSAAISGFDSPRASSFSTSSSRLVSASTSAGVTVGTPGIRANCSITRRVTPVWTAVLAVALLLAVGVQVWHGLQRGQLPLPGARQATPTTPDALGAARRLHTYRFQRGLPHAATLGTLVAAHDILPAPLPEVGFTPQATRTAFVRLGILFAEAVATLHGGAVEATAPPGSRSRRGRSGPLVGRQPELAIGRAALDLVATANRSVLLAISGENGVGKSRLADELIDHMHNSVDAAVLEGACVPYGEANVWFPIANALCRYLDLDPTLPLDDIRAVARERALQLLSTVDEAQVERMVDVFAHLLGHPSPIDRLEAPAARAAVHSAVSRVLELRSQDRPVVLSINDLHWADPALIRLLEHLVSSLETLLHAG